MTDQDSLTSRDNTAEQARRDTTASIRRAMETPNPRLAEYTGTAIRERRAGPGSQTTLR